MKDHKQTIGGGGLLIDLDINKLLNIALQPAQQPFSSRIHKSGNPELVKMYTESVHLGPSVLQGTQDDSTAA
jgi:hypothetical protein